MDVREKLVELSDILVLQREIECVKRKSATNCADCLNCDLLMTDERILSAYANAIDALQNANGVTVQEWISVDERLPKNFVSVLGYMTDAGEFPPVRECYTVGNAFFFPSLGDVHPVSHWCEMPQPPQEG